MPQHRITGIKLKDGLPRISWVNDTAPSGPEAVTLKGEMECLPSLQDAWDALGDVIGRLTGIEDPVVPTGCTPSIDPDTDLLSVKLNGTIGCDYSNSPTNISVPTIKQCKDDTAGTHMPDWVYEPVCTLMAEAEPRTADGESPDAPAETDPVEPHEHEGECRVDPEDPSLENGGRAFNAGMDAGRMARPLGEYWGRVVATDVAADQIGYGQRHDFVLEPRPADLPAGTLDAIITNPPFRLASAFVRHALPQAAVVAVLVRTAFLEGGERWRDLFDPYPPATIAQFAERVPMHKGRCLRSASTATAYCWIVWRHDPHRIGGTDFRWIPPGTRKRLERPGDYDDDAPRVEAGAA